LLVMGQHRGGTSAMAGSLYHLGGVIGANGDFHRDAHNVKGYFENADALGANEEALRLAGASWDSEEVLPADMGSDPRYDMLVMRMGDFFARDMELARDRFLVVKDPRISLLLPLYLKVFRGLGVEPSFLFCDRRNEEIARSLSAREGFDPAHAVLTAEAHRESVRRFEGDIDVAWVSAFDCLLGHRESFFRWMRDRFDLPLEIGPEGMGRVADFLDAGLRHHRGAGPDGLWGTALIRDPVRATVPEWATIGDGHAH